MNKLLDVFSEVEIFGLIARNLIGIGLSFDIAGVLILVFCTSTKRIEAELFYKLVNCVADEKGEWVHSYSFEEHKKGMTKTYDSIRRIRVLEKFGLCLIIAGFLLQLIGAYL